MDSDYKKYSLNKLEEWMHDAMSVGGATPEEIYSAIKNVVQEEYYHHKHYTGQAYELLALLNGNGKDYYTDPNQVAVDTILKCDKDDPSPECISAWNDFWESDSGSYIEYDLREAEFYKKGDKVNKWVLPVNVDGLTGECYINLPDDLLEASNLKEGDQIEYVNTGDDSYIVRKVNGTK
jgi:hypothetical protein